MSDVSTQATQPAADPGTQQPEPDGIRQVRERAERVGPLERENAFLRAGINVEDPLNRYLMSTYPGEATPEAVSQWLTSLGRNPQSLPTGQPATPTTPGTAVEPAPQQQVVTYDAQQVLRDQLHGGQPAGATDTPNRSGVDAALDKFFASTKAEETRRADFFQDLVDAGVRGDESALHNPQAWRDQREREGDRGTRPPSAVRR